MASFPQLKTSAVAQYPATRRVTFQNRVLRFLDGHEQRYRESAGPLHRWEIRLEALDEAELASMEEFFTSQQGRLGNFSFTDPWDGKAYPNCSLYSDEADQSYIGEMNGRTSLTVIENRY